MAVPCAYCEHPLNCDACRADFVPAGPEEYRALSDRDAPLACPACGARLVCHWCKEPYGSESDVDDEAPTF